MSKKPRSLSFRPSLSNDTAVREPMMIIAVTLFNTAEKTVVIAP